MDEIRTPPIIDHDAESVTFTADHTWRDVCRWIIAEGGADDVRRELDAIEGETP